MELHFYLYSSCLLLIVSSSCYLTFIWINSLTIIKNCFLLSCLYRFFLFFYIHYTLSVCFLNGPCLSCVSCCNKLLQTGWVVNNRSLLPTDLEAGSRRSGLGEGPLLGCRPLCISSHDRRGQGNSLESVFILFLNNFYFSITIDVQSYISFRHTHSD